MRKVIPGIQSTASNRIAMEEEALPVAASVDTKDRGEVTMYSSSGASGDRGWGTGALSNVVGVADDESVRNVRSTLSVLLAVKKSFIPMDGERESLNPFLPVPANVITKPPYTFPIR
jgi:hypothetical protein